jgi:hypothetical protein
MNGPGPRPLVYTFIAVLGTTFPCTAQPPALDRLPVEVLDVAPPSSRVRGAPGNMRIEQQACEHRSVDNLRRRIVDIAVQEWAFFGYSVLDQTILVDEPGPRVRGPRRRRSWLDTEESRRVAASIAGYWAVTADGGWILSRQNAVWKGPSGVGARWRDPWSAAFISWIMCESGLAEQTRFRKAIAHHAYIDQAILAREQPDSDAAYTAYDVGERPIEPGDLVCSARRPAYRNIAERRSELGSGVRTHCDIIVEIDAANERILAIGGNVRGAVRLKLLPAVFASSSGQPPLVESIGRGRRAAFAHLRLDAEPIGPDGLITSATMTALYADEQQAARLRERLGGQQTGECCDITPASHQAPGGAAR